MNNPLLKTNKRKLAIAVSAVLAGGTANDVVLAQQADEEIVVTGSRIIRRDLTAASPIVTIERETFQNSATVGVESVLNQLPQFVPAGSQFEGGGIQGGPTNSPGAATLNLRGLGTNRNLVLVNGRRPQPANASLVVDVNTIPTAAIGNVEVITGGASAVYGPDAMAGVVNFILRDDFEGLELDFQTGQTAEGDGTESRVSALFGANAEGGRGNVMIGLDFTKRDSVFQHERDWYINGWNDPGTVGGGFLNPWTYGTNESNIPGGRNLPSQAAMDAVFAQYGLPAGTLSPDSNIIFNTDGTAFSDVGGYNYRGPLNCWQGCGTFTGIKQLPNGDLDQTFTDSFLSFPLERSSVFLTGHYEVAENIRAFTQAQFTNSSVLTRGGIPPAITIWQAPIPRDGRTLPADLNTLLDSRANPAGDWSLYDVLAYNGPIEPENDTTVRQLMIGLEGELGDHTWEAYYSKGDTSIAKTNWKMPSLQRYQALVAAPNFGAGGVVGSPNSYNITCDSGLPVFNDFTPDAECLRGIEGEFIDQTELTQNIFEVFFQGRVADIYAGEIRYAAGATYRENSFTFEPSNPAGQLSDNPIGLFAARETGGTIDVSEWYGELLVPLAEGFELELGYRYSDFSTAGGHDTYKGLFTWDATDTISVRGGFQRATRAPNVAELFTSPSLIVVFIPGQEPCSATTTKAWGNLPSNPDRQQVQDLCRQMIGNNTSDFDTQTYSVLGISGPDGWHRRIPPFFPLEIEEQRGNPLVEPEFGTTYTLGAVFNGTIVDNLTLSVDFYQIEIEGAISPLSASTVYDNCFNAFGTNPTYDINNEFCQAIQRNPTSGDRSRTDAPFFNLGTLETAGMDLTANWITDLGPGTFGINSQLSFLDYYKFQDAPGANTFDATGTLARGGLYDMSALTRFTFSANNWSLGLTWRYLPSVEDAAFAEDPTTPNRPAGSYSEFNLNGRYNWNAYSLRFGIDNLFDTDPENIGAVNPGVDNNATSTDPGYYDLLGRTYFVGLEMSFE
jgi:outer membrane receptor protein involved in Fe transport